MSTERTPLLQGRPSGLSASRPPVELTDEELLAQESAFSASMYSAHWETDADLYTSLST